MPTTEGSVSVPYEGIYFDIFRRIQAGELTREDVLWFLSLSRRELDKLSSVPRPKPLTPAEDLRLPLGGESQGVIPVLEIPMPGADELLESFRADTSPVEQFVLLADLGIITVPHDYNHATCLTKFRERYDEHFCNWDEHVTDENFPNPTRIMKPGDRFQVRAFTKVGIETSSTEERMAFLYKQRAVHTGMQGISLVFEQKRDQLPKERWYVSYDEPEHLWGAETGNCPCLPLMFCFPDGTFTAELIIFALYLDYEFAFLCFTEVE